MVNIENTFSDRAGPIETNLYKQLEGFQYQYSKHKSRRNVIKKFMGVGSDSKKSFLDKLQNKHQRQTLLKHGWIDDNDQPIHFYYYYNKYGFRVQSEKEMTADPKTGGVLYIGDSHVFGVGGRYEENFTYLAHHNSKNFSDLPYHNLGMPGRGIECYYRVLKYYIPIYKPICVFLDFPHNDSRVEYYDGKQFQTQIAGQSFRSDEFHFMEQPVALRWFKNIDAIKYVCSQSNTQLLCPSDEDILKYVNRSLIDKYINHKRNMLSPSWKTARDLQHAGKKWHTIASENLKEILNEL